MTPQIFLRSVILSIIFPRRYESAVMKITANRLYKRKTRKGKRKRATKRGQKESKKKERRSARDIIRDCYSKRNSAFTQRCLSPKSKETGDA